MAYRSSPVRIHIPWALRRQAWAYQQRGGFRKRPGPHVYQASTKPSLWRREFARRSPFQKLTPSATFINEGTPSAKTQELTVKQIIEIHKFMLQELESLANSSDLASKKSQLDVKTVTIVAQAKIGAKMEEKFNVASEDLEAAVLLYHTMLATDQEFAKVNMEIQHTMGKLMGSQGAGDP